MLSAIIFDRRRTPYLAAVLLSLSFGFTLTGCGDDTLTESTSSIGGTLGGATTTTSGTAGTITGTGAGAATADTGSASTGDEVDEYECDVWTQDCPEGQKCMPWANDGTTSWNATKCSPVDPNPGQPGDSCIAEDFGYSGVDDCDESSMCWGYFPWEGECVAFCEGSEESPSCDPGFYCANPGDSPLILCLPLPNCDPLLQDCPGDDLCVSGDDAFTCVLDASGETGAYGDPCEFANVCDPGLACLFADNVPGCQAADCCSPFCDTDEPIACPDEEQVCIPWYEEGLAPPGQTNVGICGIL